MIETGLLDKKRERERRKRRKVQKSVDQERIITHTPVELLMLYTIGTLVKGEEKIQPKKIKQKKRDTIERGDKVVSDGGGSWRVTAGCVLLLDA